MIDKLHITIKLIDIPLYYHYFLWNKITSESHKAWGYNPERSVKGWFNSIHISLNELGLLIYFNPTKYLLGDNLGLITIVQFEALIKQLSDELEIDLFKGEVKRLDLGGNIVTEFPVAEYQELLFSANYLKRYALGSSLYFKNKKSRCLIIYNKVAEMRSNKTKFNNFLKDKYILRYEYRYLKHAPLSTFLKIKTVKVEHIILYWSNLVDEWVRVFLEIKKEKEQLVFKKDAWSIKGEVDRQLKIIAINSLGGLHHLHKLVDMARERGDLKYTAQSAHFKSKFNKWMNHPSMFEVSNKVLEVEMKVKRLGENCKRDIYDFL